MHVFASLTVARATRTAAAAVLVSALAGSAAAQSAPPPPTPPARAEEAHAAHHMSTGWKELDQFHTLMAAAWHPAKDGGNLKPAREHATKLVDAAKLWAASKGPTTCDTKPVRDAVQGVASDTRAFADLVGKQTADSVLKSALSALHDRFEIANKACSKAHH